MSIERNAKGELWFHEYNEQWPGVANSLEVVEILHDAHSQYQHVQVFKSRSFGNVLVLDGVLQVTERDECAYQEMMVHLPMFSHPCPRRVLVVGAGDGGILREICRHPCVEEVVICEIDQMVIDCSKRYLPGVAIGWSDSRVHLHCGDASLFIKRPENLNSFDIIISDTSDPVGPAQPLFEAQFYKDMKAALRPGGIISTQAESIWQNLELIKKLVRFCTPIFDAVEYGSTQIPTYPCGQIGVLCCSVASSAVPKPTCKKPIREITPQLQSQLRYYTPEMHVSNFVQPAFVARAIAESEQAGRAAAASSSAAPAPAAAAAAAGAHSS